MSGREKERGRVSEANGEMVGDELPAGWAWATVAGVIGDCQPGFASGDKNVEDGVAHLRMNNIGLLGQMILDLVRTVPEKLAKPQHELQPGDVLVCTTNSAKLVGKCAIFELEGRYAFSNHLTRLRPNRDAIDGSYLRWCLWSLWQAGTFDDKCKHWVNQSTIPKDALLEAAIPLPPLPEQRRIVGKLELLLGKVSSSQQRLSRIPGLLKRFRQSVLAAACSGKLTADWREENRDSPTAIATALGEVCEFIGGSQPAKDHFIYEPRAGYIRLIQIRDYKSDKNWTFIPVSMARRFCSATDVMIGRYGPPLFQILRGIDGAYNVALMKAVPRNHDILSNEFLFYMLQDPTLRNDVIQFSERTVGQDGVRKDLLEAYVVRIPPLPEQQEIVRRVEKLFAFADQIEARLKRAQEHVDRLTQSLLAKAFRGELVPTEHAIAAREGREYETASQLIERIRATQAKAPTAKPKRGRRSSGEMKG